MTPFFKKIHVLFALMFTLISSLTSAQNLDDYKSPGVEKC